jgi:hypothetical protein
MDKDEIIKALEEENVKLKDELRSTKEHLKKYTAPSSRKEYYEKNKTLINDRNKKYKENTNYKPTQEQKKEYNRQAYLKRKKKLEKEKSGNQTI